MGPVVTTGDTPAAATRGTDGCITSWPASMEARYGFTSAQALGRPIGELLRTIFLQPRGQADSELADCGQWTGEVMNHHASGRMIPTVQHWVLRAGAVGNDAQVHEAHQDPSPAALAESSQFAMTVDTIARDLSEALTAIAAYNFGLRVLMQRIEPDLQALRAVATKQETQVARATASMHLLRSVINHSRPSVLVAPARHSTSANHTASGSQDGEAPPGAAARIEELAPALTEWLDLEQQIGDVVDLPEATMSYRARDRVLAPLLERQQALIDRLCAAPEGGPPGQNGLAQVILHMVQDRGDSQAPSWGFDQQDKARMVAALLQALPEPAATR